MPLWYNCVFSDTNKTKSMTVQLYDTLTKLVKPLQQTDGNSYRFYCCGPTVYGPSHIGNFRTFLIQDVFRRVLELADMNPFHVRNLTDVDDKTIRQSQASGLSLTDFTQKWTTKFHQDCEALNMLKPHKEAAATDHIPHQISMIETLIAKGHAYVAQGGSVYFKVSSFKEYGKLSHLDPESLQTQSTTSSGAANTADEYNRESVADFALWKAYKDEDGPNAWDSPWGKGRPGWHIECSAMSKAYLGNTFDLHAGGIDLCFPHHENEIAQSEGANQEPLVNHWFHTYHLKVDGKKMSKSLGNLYTLEDIKEKGYSVNVLRYLLISSHYRQALNFTMDGLNAAQSAIQKLGKLAKYLMNLAEIDQMPEVKEAPQIENWLNFKAAWDALCHDLNTPMALGAIFMASKELEQANDLDKSKALQSINALNAILYTLGIKLFTEQKDLPEASEKVQTLAQQRWEAKKRKDFALSDKLRDEIAAEGWQVLDYKDSFDLEPLDN